MKLKNPNSNIYGHISPVKIIEMAKSGKYNFTLSDQQFLSCDTCSATKLTAPFFSELNSRLAASPSSSRLKLKRSQIFFQRSSALVEQANSFLNSSSTYVLKDVERYFLILRNGNRLGFLDISLVLILCGFGVGRVLVAVPKLFIV